MGCSGALPCSSLLLLGFPPRGTPRVWRGGSWWARWVVGGDFMLPFVRRCRSGGRDLWPLPLWSVSSGASVSLLGESGGFTCKLEHDFLIHHPVSGTGQRAEARRVVSESVQEQTCSSPAFGGLGWFCPSQGMRDCELEHSFGGLCDLGKENFLNAPAPLSFHLER